MNEISSQIKSEKYSKRTFSVKKFEVIDIRFNIKKKIDEPFEVEFGAEFTDPNGRTMKVPGFFNGNDEWVIRFSAKQIGKWQFTSYASFQELNKHKGRIEVLASSENKHGAIVIDKDDPRKFAYEDGTPYFLQGFEIDWLFALDYDNPDSAPKTEHILDLLAKNGINQIVTTLYSYDVRWEKDTKLKSHPEHEFGSRDDIYPFLGSNRKPNHSSLNITFFQRFDRLVDIMHQKDLVANLMIYVWNKKVKWPKPGSKEDNHFFDYVIKRYSAFPNVVWNISKEAFRHKVEYMSERIERAKKLDVFDRLLTIHDFKKTDNIDFISLQNWESTLYTSMLEEYTKYNKPVYNIEHGGYAKSTYTVFPGDYTNPEECLKRNYLCYFAGVYANYYWQDLAWNVMVYNPYEQDDSCTKPKFEYYKYLHSFFTKIGYQDFYPCSKFNKSAYCLKNDKGIILYYIPKENYQLSVYGNKDAAIKQGTYQWFNTITGEYTESYTYEGGFFKNPFENEADAILIRDTNAM